MSHVHECFWLKTNFLVWKQIFDHSFCSSLVCANWRSFFPYLCVQKFHLFSKCWVVVCVLSNSLCFMICSIKLTWVIAEMPLKSTKCHLINADTHIFSNGFDKCGYCWNLALGCVWIFQNIPTFAQKSFIFEGYFSNVETLSLFVKNSFYVILFSTETALRRVRLRQFLFQHVVKTLLEKSEQMRYKLFKNLNTSDWIAVFNLTEMIIGVFSEF